LFSPRPLGACGTASVALPHRLQAWSVSDVSTFIQRSAAAKAKSCQQPPRNGSRFCLGDGMTCSAPGRVAPRGSAPQIQPSVRQEREQNPFGLALFSPRPERGALELWKEDKESKTSHQVMKNPSREGSSERTGARGRGGEGNRRLEAAGREAAPLGFTPGSASGESPLSLRAPRVGVRPQAPSPAARRGEGAGHHQ